jgi:hypothetical protein
LSLAYELCSNLRTKFIWDFIGPRSFATGDVFVSSSLNGLVAAFRADSFYGEEMGKANSVGAGEIRTDAEKKSQQRKKLDKELEVKEARCIREYDSKDECYTVRPLYSGYQKCALCDRGGKI